MLFCLALDGFITEPFYPTHFVAFHRQNPLCTWLCQHQHRHDSKQSKFDRVNHKRKIYFFKFTTCTYHLCFKERALKSSMELFQNLLFGLFDHWFSKSDWLHVPLITMGALNFFAFFKMNFKQVEFGFCFFILLFFQNKTCTTP